MIIEWLWYCALVSLLLGGAARVGESALRAARLPVRWAWAGALAGSLVLPVAAWVGPVLPLPVVGDSAGGAAPTVLPLSLDLAVPEAAQSLDGPLLLIWLLASALLAAVVVAAQLRLVVSRRRWGRGEVDGVPVYVSRNVGPAALGLVRGVIVLPEWALELEQRLRRLMVVHETEHVRAGDPRLVWIGLAALVAMPWNAVAWWQFRRLRLAIELDCDARVLRGHSDARSYGELLLEVARRHCGGSLVAATLTEPRNLLERRIHMLMKPRRPVGVARTSALAASAVALGVLACEAPEPSASTWEIDPSASDDAFGEVLDQAAARATRDVVDCTPLFIVDDEVVSPVERGDDGRVRFDPGIDPSTIERVEVIKGRAAEFVTDDPRATCGVIRIQRKHGARPASTGTDAAGSPGGAGGEYASFTPDMRRPELRNAAEVIKALDEQYPPLLRDAGIGGTAMVDFWIDDRGRVTKFDVAESSGYPALDEAATKVADIMEFSPAALDGVARKVMVRMPVAFRVH